MDDAQIISELENRIRDIEERLKALEKEQRLIREDILSGNMKERMRKRMLEKPSGKREEIKEKYDNVFRVQDLVGEKIIDGLKINFSFDERNRMIVDTVKHPVSYDYYQLSLIKPTTTKGNLEAIDLLEKSILYDSTYAPAYNQLGFRIHSLTSYNLRGIRQLEEAEVALNKALIFNPELLSSLGNLARIYTETGRLLEAQKLVQQMFDINQNSAFAHFVQGYIYRYAGLLNEARREMEKAVTIDPTDRTFRSLGITYFYLGEFDRALKAFDIATPSFIGRDSVQITDGSISDSPSRLSTYSTVELLECVKTERIFRF